MQLKVESEKVLAAAKKCPEWKDGLKELFPEAFEDDKYFDLQPLSYYGEGGLFTKTQALEAGFLNEYFMTLRTTISPGSMVGKAFCLDRKYEWELRRGANFHELIPTRK